MKLNDIMSNPDFKDRLKLIDRIKVNREYDIPYLGGYSKDGSVVYIDRHVPNVINGIPVMPFLKVHEVAEKAIIDIFGVKYQDAHRLASQIEKMLVEKKEIAWKDYTKVLKPFIKTTANEKLKKIPNDLDLTPYVDSRDYKKLKSLLQK